MNRLAEQVTSDEQWPVFCVRNHNRKVVDGYGCTEDAYLNLTSYLNPLIDTLDDETLKRDVRLAAPMIIKQSNLRNFLSKDFSEENPDSNIMGTVFQLTNQPMITEIVDG